MRELANEEGGVEKSCFSALGAKNSKIYYFWAVWQK